MEKIENTKISFIIFLVLTSFIFLLEARTAFSENESLTIGTTGSMPYVDPAILEAFNNSSEVRVIVEVRDMSGISVSVSDSVEEQMAKDAARKVFLDNRIDAVLSRLSSGEVDVEGRFVSGRGFYGDLTKSGFDKLVNDSDVAKIFLSGVSYTGLNLVSSEVTENNAAEVNETGSVSGFIKPAIEGVAIFAKVQGEKEFQSTTIVKEDGSYEIRDLKPGIYGLFIPETENFYMFKWSFIEIEANKHLTGYNLTLTPQNSSYLFDQIIVKFLPDVSFEEKISTINSYGSVIMNYNHVVTSIENANQYTLNIPDDKTVSEMVELFQSNPKVKLASPNRILRVTAGSSTEENVIEDEESGADDLVINDGVIFSDPEKHLNGTEEALGNEELRGSGIFSAKKIILFYGVMGLAVIIMFLVFYSRKSKKRELSVKGKLLMLLAILIIINLIAVSFAVAEEGTGGGATNVAISGEREEKLKEDSASCIDVGLFKKVDKNLRSILILNDTNESYVGFHILLAEKDISCDFKNILEQKNLKITYSTPNKLIYLAFTSENITNKINEIKNLSFVEAIYSDRIKAPAIDSTAKKLFIDLNQGDNVSSSQEVIGGKNMSVYNQPGDFGRTLEQKGVELLDYDEDLKSYYALATLEVIREIIALPFVIFVEQVSGGSVASIEETYQNLSVTEEPTSEDVIEETETKSVEILKEEETDWFSKLFSSIIRFFKSVFNKNLN